MVTTTDALNVLFETLGFLTGLGIGLGIVNGFLWAVGSKSRFWMYEKQ